MPDPARKFGYYFSAVHTPEARREREELMRFICDYHGWEYEEPTELRCRMVYDGETYRVLEDPTQCP